MRRLFVLQLHVGAIDLPAEESHHARTVLRLRDGAEVELFDAQGRTALARLQMGTGLVRAVVTSITDAPAAPSLHVLAAVPKGERADWMVEKLSELGVTRWTPLRCERSVVEPGEGKLAKWRRRCIEAAKQSGRLGVMAVDEPAPFLQCLSGGGVLLHPSGGVALADASDVGRLLIGPEGDFSDAELAAAAAAGLIRARLGDTILRVETAAIAAAAMLLCRPHPILHVAQATPA